MEDLFDLTEAGIIAFRLIVVAKIKFEGRLLLSQWWYSGCQDGKGILTAKAWKAPEITSMTSHDKA
jgi:hypothetical protein